MIHLYLWFKIQQKTVVHGHNNSEYNLEIISSLLLQELLIMGLNQEHVTKNAIDGVINAVQI